MATGLYHQLKFIQGEDVVLSFDIQEDNVYLDLSNLTFAGQIQGQNGAPVAAATFIFTQNVDDVNVFDATLSDTSLLTGEYKYEIRYTNNTTSITEVMLYGDVKVSPTVLI